MDRGAGGVATSNLGRVEAFEADLRSVSTRASALGWLQTDPLLQAAVAEVYELPTEDGRCGLDFSRCELLSVSAERTGFVLGVRSRPEHLWGPTQALVVKFLYLDGSADPAAIAALGAEAAATRSGHPERYVFAGERVLVTVRVPGIKIIDWVERQPWWRSEGGARGGTYVPERVEAMRTIGISLCRALTQLSLREVGGHGNLDLGSILVAEDAGVLRVNLVDLAPDATLRAAGRGPAVEDCVRADAEGVGVAMLQVATPYRIDPSPRLEGESVQRALAELWGDAPGFARIVEDLVDPDPSNRLAMLSEDHHGEDPWGDLERRIQDEYDLQRMFRPATDSPGGDDANVTNWDQVRRYFQATRQLKASSNAGRQSSALLRWINILAYALWVLSLTGFVLLTSADLGFDAPGGATATFIERHARFTVGNFDANFPGRLIAISFAYIVLTFYMRILSGVTVRRLGIPWIELSFRSAPLLLNLPILVVIYYDPALWPAAATAGLLGTVAVCLAMRELDRRALASMEEQFRYSAVALREAREAREPHASWWRSLSGYLLLVLVPLDLGLYSSDLGLSGHDILRDGGFYALILTFGCNAYAIYWNSVRKLERNTRGCLEQSSFILQRAARLERSSLTPSVFAASQVRGGALAFLPAIPVLVATAYLAASWNRTSTQWVLVGVGLACATATALTLAGGRRLGRDRPVGTTARACVAVATGFACLAFLSVGAVAFDGPARLAALALCACVATVLGDQVFRGAVGAARRRLRARRRRPAPEEALGQSLEEAFAAAAVGLEASRPAGEVSVELGCGLIGTSGEPSFDEVESRLAAAWEKRPHVARLAERLLMRAPQRRIVVTGDAELRRLRGEIEGGEATRVGPSRLFLPARRAEICLPTPGGRLRPEVLRTLRLVGFASVAIALVCTAGWLWYAVTDFEWNRTAGRTIALSYSVSAVYYYRTIIGWITVEGMRRAPTELALRSVPFVFQGPAITAIFLWPGYWPLEATIGVGATAIVNYLMLRLIDDASQALRESGGWSAAEAARLRETHFASWWTTAAIYLSGMVLFDVLLTATHVLHDAALYALVLAAGANIFLIVFSSLRQHGPEVRGQVSRAVMLLGVLSPTPSRVPLRVEAPRGLLLSQAALVGLCGLWLSLIHVGSGTLALEALISFGVALAALLAAAAAQSLEGRPDSPRAQALSRLMASLGCWATGAALFAVAVALEVQLAALVAFLGAMAVALWRADATPPPPPRVDGR